MLVAKTIKSALELPLSSSSNSNKDIKVLLSRLYITRLGYRIVPYKLKGRGKGQCLMIATDWQNAVYI